MINRKDRYEDYTDELFNYKYPYSWEDRSFNCLEVLPERNFKEEQDIIFPSERTINKKEDWYRKNDNN